MPELSVGTASPNLDKPELPKKRDDFARFQDWHLAHDLCHVDGLRADEHTGELRIAVLEEPVDHLLEIDMQLVQGLALAGGPARSGPATERSSSIWPRPSRPRRSCGCRSRPGTRLRQACRRSSSRASSTSRTRLGLALSVAGAPRSWRKHARWPRLRATNCQPPSGRRVKVLDFGLAKALEPAGAMPATDPLSPTITTPAMTQAGMILGTAAYMSPEQARGSR